MARQTQFEQMTDCDVEDLSFKRRADRALAEYDGVVERGQDILYECRWQEADGTRKRLSRYQENLIVDLVLVTSPVCDGVFQLAIGSALEAPFNR
jgi:hypothetical protein